MADPSKAPYPEQLCDHCWHASQGVYTSLPPQWDEKCCWCGKVERRIGQPLNSDLGHGPHYMGGFSVQFSRAHGDSGIGGEK